MSEFKLPHVENLATNSKLPGQLTENFKAIEQEDKDDDQALSDEVADRKKGDDGLNQRIKTLEETLDRVIAEMVKLNSNQDKLQEEVDELYNFGRHDRQVILEHINLEKLR